MNAHASMGSRLALVAALTLLLAGCLTPTSLTADETPLPFSCYRFGEAFWGRFRFGDDSPVDVIATVTDLLGIEKKQVRVGRQQEGVVIEWNDIMKESAYYSAQFDREGKLWRIAVSWDRHQPTLGRVIECLGEPDYYDSFFYPAPEAKGYSCIFGMKTKVSLLEAIPFTVSITSRQDSNQET